MAHRHDQIYIEEKKCTRCGKCKAACPKGPKSLLNRRKTRKKGLRLYGRCDHT